MMPGNEHHEEHDVNCYSTDKAACSLLHTWLTRPLGTVQHMHTGGSDKRPTVRRHPFVQIVNLMDLLGGQANMQVVLQEG